MIYLPFASSHAAAAAAAAAAVVSPVEHKAFDDSCQHSTNCAVVGDAVALGGVRAAGARPDHFTGNKSVYLRRRPGAWHGGRHPCIPAARDGGAEPAAGGGPNFRYCCAPSEV